MKMIFVLLALGMWTLPPAQAAEPKPKFQVGPISKGRTSPGTRRINGEYPKSKPTIEFTVTVTEDTQKKDLVANLYFFDANNTLVYQTGAIPELDQTKLQEEYDKKLERMKRENPKATSFVITIEGQNTLQAGKKYQYRHTIQDQDPKWTHIVVVVGSRDGDRTARVFPKFDTKVLNFPDKPKVTYWYQS